MICGEDHPDLSVSCELREESTLHDEHMGFKDGEVLLWPNTDFSIQKVSSGASKGNADAMLAMADRVRSREAAPVANLSDPDEDTPGKARTDGQQTSRDAAYAITPKTGTQRRAVLDLVAASGAGGMIHLEMEHALHGKASPSSVRTRCSELVAGGWIMDSGERRPTPSGMSAIVWVMTPEGLSKFS